MSEEKESFVMRPMYIFGAGFFTGWAMLRLYVWIRPSYEFKWNAAMFLIDVVITLIFLLCGITKKGECDDT